MSCPLSVAVLAVFDCLRVDGVQVTDRNDIVLAGMKLARFTMEMKTKFEVPVCALYNSVFRTIITVAGRSVRMWSAVDGSIVKEFKLIASSVRERARSVMVDGSAQGIGLWTRTSSSDRIRWMAACHGTCCCCRRMRVGDHYRVSGRPVSSRRVCCNGCGNAWRVAPWPVARVARVARGRQ